MKIILRFLLCLTITASPVWAQQNVVIYTPSQPYTTVIPIGCSYGINFAPITGYYCAPYPIPTGLVTFVISGTCPSGWSQVAALNGMTLVGTVAANGDVGTTGGANTITPTVATLTAAAQTFTGSALGTHSHTGGTYSAAAQVVSWPVGVPTISGTTINAFSSVINHTHTMTTTAASRVQGGTTAAVTGTHIMTSTATGGSARAPTSGDLLTGTSDNPAGGVASITPTINAAGTIAWPAGVPTNASSAVSGTSQAVSAGTPAGTNGTSAVTGTLNNFDNRSAFVKVIFCSAN